MIQIIKKEVEDWLKDDDEKASKITRKLNHRISFQDNYFKEMIYIKDYTFLSLFANAGGYIGKLSVNSVFKQVISRVLGFLLIFVIKLTSSV